MGLELKAEEKSILALFTGDKNRKPEVNSILKKSTI